MAVDVEVRTLTNTLKLHEDLLVFVLLLQAEVLAIPDDRIRQVVNIEAEGLILVEGAGEGHLFPIPILEMHLLCLGDIPDTEQPCGVEVELFAHGRSRGCLADTEPGNQ